MYSDSETGLYYWGARYYDPKTGRGLSADRRSVGKHVQEWLARLGSGKPNQPPLELNPYVYTANNPLRWIDPTGEVNVAPEFGGTGPITPYPLGDIPPYVEKPLSSAEQAMLANQ
jgi:RHS repeat-associated protein